MHAHTRASLIRQLAAAAVGWDKKPVSRSSTLLYSKETSIPYLVTLMFGDRLSWRAHLIIYIFDDGRG